MNVQSRLIRHHLCHRGFQSIRQSSVQFVLVLKSVNQPSTE